MNSTFLQQAIGLANAINTPAPHLQICSSQEEMDQSSKDIAPRFLGDKVTSTLPEFLRANFSVQHHDNPRLRAAEIQRTVSIRSQQTEIDQALEIAIHYLRCQSLAMNLKDAWSLRRSAKNSGHSTTELDEAILYFADQIKEIHAGDLGLKIEWV